MVRLFIVEDVFNLTGRVVLTPGVSRHHHIKPAALLELRLPDGSVLKASVGGLKCQGPTQLARIHSGLPASGVTTLKLELKYGDNFPFAHAV